MIGTPFSPGYIGCVPPMRGPLQKPHRGVELRNHFLSNASIMSLRRAKKG
jgi:hypothetical protein